MATFSTNVTQAQRDAIDYNTRGRAISTCSRQNTKRPGYNPSPYEPKIAPKTVKIGKTLGVMNRGELTIIVAPPKQKPAAVQVRPNTKRGSRGVATPKHERVNDHVTLDQFYNAGCEFLHDGEHDLTTVVFIGIKDKTGDVCTTGCAYFKQGKCPAYLTLINQGKDK